jgi:hypothetical protein
MIRGLIPYELGGTVHYALATDGVRSSLLPGAARRPQGLREYLTARLLRRHPYLPKSARAVHKSQCGS